MFSFYKKYARTFFDIAILIFTVYLSLSLFSFLYNIATPVFIALFIYLIIEPFASFLHRKGLKKSTATTISTLSFAVFVVVGGLLLGTLLGEKLYKLSSEVPSLVHMAQEQFFQKNSFLESKINSLPFQLDDKAKEYLSTLTDKGTNFATQLLSQFITAFTSFSKFMIDFAIGLLLAYFLSVEIDSWKEFVNKRVPRTLREIFSFFKSNVLVGIGKFIKAQFILGSLTFLFIFSVLLILKANNSFLIAFLSSICSPLPILGVATVLIPWIGYLFLIGNTHLAIYSTGLLILTGILRQIFEPKIIGDSIGVSAFTMLSFMIIASSLFGIGGLLVSPVLIILIKALQGEGYLSKWIYIPEDEFQK